MLAAIATLLICQLTGEILVRSAGLPIPGPVVGLGLLLLAMALRPRLAEQTGPTARVILAHLSLLFVPAGVGVISNAALLANNGIAIVVILVVSTVLAMLAAVGSFLAVQRLIEGKSNG